MANSTKLNWLLLNSVLALLLVSTLSNRANAQSEAVSSNASDSSAEQPEEEHVVPWDYSPYKVLIWVASDDPQVNAASLEKPLRTFLDARFSAIWRMTIADAPSSIRAQAKRDMQGISYQALVSADPVIALKRNHKDTIRIRTPRNITEYVKAVYGTPKLIDEVKRLAKEKGDNVLNGAETKFKAVDPGKELAAQWAEESTEAILVARGMVESLTEPEAKIVKLPIAGLLEDKIEEYDKIYVVHVDQSTSPGMVYVTECETLMRYFGDVASSSFVARVGIPGAIGRAVTKAFSPVVRVENAGIKAVTGLIRARGLIVDEDSPGTIDVDDVLVPMVRKNDRNGRPLIIGPMDWAYLSAVEPEIAVLSVAKGVKIGVGNFVTEVNGNEVMNAQQFEKAIRGNDAMTVTVEGKQPKKIDLHKIPVPFQLRYLGFTLGIRRGRTTISGVIPFGPADKKLMLNDVIETIAGSKVPDVVSASRLIASADPTKPIKVVVLREDETIEVDIDPGDIPARKKKSVANIAMDFFAGRAGGLQGRKNKRTFRIALKVEPLDQQTLVRLHVKGQKTEPLIGYEIYEKQLNTKKMTFVGRTDWDGRISIDAKPEHKLRLLYVKNGGAVLARLPLVPGLTQMEIADLTGDDIRLRAEAYIRGVENSIVDLVAVRKLFAARIRLRLQRGEMEKANELMQVLRDQPDNEKLSNEMGKKNTKFLDMDGLNMSQRAKIDNMFKSTRNMLSKMLTSRDINQLEEDLLKAQQNGGVLPIEASDQDEIDLNANDVSKSSDEKKK